jgi:hypothetical protein
MRYFRRNLNLYQELAREHVAHCERLKMAYSVEKLQKFLYEKFIFERSRQAELLVSLLAKRCKEFRMF